MEYKLQIKKYRKLRNMTQKELARKAKVKQSYISQLENPKNTKSPSLRTILDIAYALNVCPYALINLIKYTPPCLKNDCSNCKQFFH